MIASRKALSVVAAFVLMAIGLPWGGNVPAAFAQIQVLTANPNTGDQGTLALNVTIGGKGFKKGAKANFYLKGTTNPAGISVRATKFVSDASLVATIDVAAGATPDNFDIVVANADGRTGKGTELFKVTVKINPCTQPDPGPTPSSFLSYGPGPAGYLDGNFGSGTGKVIGPRHMQIGYLQGKPLAVQYINGQARVVAVGVRHDSCATSSAWEWTVARYLPDGALDPSFGSTGTVTLSFASGAYARGVVVQADNKIVVVGGAPSSRSSSQLPTVVRFNPNGTLDSGFGTGGIVTVTPPGKNPGGQFYAAAIQADGKIVASGHVGYSATAIVVRLEAATGRLDSTFGTTGLYTYPDGEASFEAVSMQWVGSSERIVIAGSTRDDLGHWIGGVWRFNRSGALDTTFGTPSSSGRSGMVTTSFHDETSGYTFEDEFQDMAIDASNRIVVAGYALTHRQPTSSYPSEARVVLARYTDAGEPDPGFGVGGMVSVPSHQAYEIGRAIAIMGDGSILVGGESRLNIEPSNDLAGIWRLTATGVVDVTFGDAGWLSDPIATGTRAVDCSGLVLQADGKAVWGGVVIMESNPAFTYAIVARFWQ
jgi:uncharacterized delta-60 repeat protein